MNSQAAIALVRPERPQRTVVWRNGGPLTQAALLFEARRLAESLPERRHVLNGCVTRDGFMVAFLAALLRGQITILPNDRTRRVTAALGERFPGLYCLSDGARPLEGLETWPVASGPLASPPESEVPRLPADRTAAIVFTSGSTGDPVANEKSLGVLATTAELIALRFGLDSDAPAAILATVPPQHMYGLETSIAVPLWSGASVHGARPLYPADVAAALAALPAPRILVTTPIHLRALIAAKVDLPALQSVISATAPLSPDLAGQAEARFNTSVFEIFGFSEAGTVATRRTVDGARWRACDGLTLSREDDVCFVDAPHFPAPVALQDSVELHSPQVFELLGRSADNINIAGKRASLSGLNAMLNAIDGVTDGAFHSSDEGGDSGKVRRLTAFVVAPERSHGEIKAALQRIIDPTFMPRQIYLVSSLPRSDTGKLPHAALAELAAAMRSKHSHDPKHSHDH
jgi:acyl-coenzyme A synthetase/AMP-(fatty) acid ligase